MIPIERCGTLARRLATATLTCFFTAIVAPLAFGADFPQKPVRIVIGFAAGGGADGNLRVVASQLSADLGQSVLVENRAGASGVIAAQYVAGQPADGYTLLYGSSGLAVHAAKPKPLVDISKQFVPVLVFGTVSYVLVVSPKLEVKTMQELIAYAKAHAGQMNYSSVGIGSSGHLGFEAIKRVTGIQATHVPFKSTAQTSVAIVSGDVQMGLEPYTSVRPLVEAGRLRVVAIASQKRSALFPNLPSLAEQGVPGVEVHSWTGILAPNGTPADAVQRLNSGLNAAVKKPEVRAILERAGYSIIAGAPEELTRILDTEIPQWSRVIRDGNINFD